MSREFEIAKSVILAYLKTGKLTGETLNEIWLINNNSMATIDSHITALINILARAKDEIISKGLLDKGLLDNE